MLSLIGNMDTSGDFEYYSISLDKVTFESYLAPFIRFFVRQVYVKDKRESTTTRKFFIGLVAIELFRETKKWKYKKLATKMADRLEGLAKKGAINCFHKYLILKAELLATKGSVDDVKSFDSVDDIRRVYDKAIATSQRAGFSQDAALACEKAGEYFYRLRESGEDTFWPEVCLSRAHRLYSEWGATAKANELLKRRTSFIDDENSQVGDVYGGLRKSKNIKGRQRFSDVSQVSEDRQSDTSRRLGVNLSTLSRHRSSLSIATNSS